MTDHSLVSIDLAKNVFQVCRFSDDNKVLSNKRISRKKLSQEIAQLSPTTVVMEACYSAHYWGRVFEQYGHTVKLVPAQHVKPFVRGNKNDVNDAIAIGEASLRPNMKFVRIKTVELSGVNYLGRFRVNYPGRSVACSCLNQLWQAGVLSGNFHLPVQ